MRQICLIFVLSALAFVAGCSKNSMSRQADFEKWIQPDGKLKVLSTIEMISDVAEQIGGDRVAVLSLIQGNLDPHSYQLVKGDDEKLAFADLIFYNGLGLEHGPSLRHYLADHDKAIGLGDLIEKEDPSIIVYVNGQKDPHIWMDIALWAKIVPIIVKTLSEKDPSHAAYFAKNAEKVLFDMEQAHAQVKEILHRVPQQQRYLVTSHDAFNYFTRAYMSEEGEVENNTWEKRFAAPEGLAPESQLSTSDIKEIIDHLQQYQIHLIFPESNVSRDSIRKIVQAGKEQGLDVRIACCPVYADAMGAPGSDGDTYLKMIVHNANMLAEHMTNSQVQHNIDIKS